MANNLAFRARKIVNHSSLMRVMWPVYYARTPLDRGNFVVFHTGRCGSTVLTDLLHQHRDVYCGGELFYGYYGPAKRFWQEEGVNTSSVWTSSPYFPRNPIGFLRTQIPWAGIRPHYGFEITLYQMKWNGFAVPNFIEDLARCRVGHFVVLQRRNYLKKIISGMVASQKGSFHAISGDEAKLNKIRLDVTDVKVDFDEKPLLDYFEEFDRGFQVLRESLVDKKSLWLTYEEDILSNPLIGYQKCVDFLGLKSQAVDVRSSKNNPFPLRDVLINHEEVETLLKGSPYEWMLAE